MWSNWNEMLIAHQQNKLAKADADKQAAEAAQAQYLQGMLKQYGFSGDPLEVKEGLWDKITPWQTNAEKARPYADQLLNNSALALDKDWYDQNVAPNQKTGVLKGAEWMADKAAQMPTTYGSGEQGMDFPSRNPYQGMSREDLMNQQPAYDMTNTQMAGSGVRGTQPMDSVLQKKTNTEKFLEYLKQSAGAKL